MLRSLKDIVGYNLAVEDGKIGKCKDCLFDDKKWTVRFLDVDTGNWLPGRRILVSPISLKEPDWKTNTIFCYLTKGSIEESPSLEENAPVSKQWEEDYFTHYGWGHYTLGGYLWGPSTYPNEIAKVSNQKLKKENMYDAHLRSVEEVTGYQVKASDNTFGLVNDLIFDTETWRIRYLVVDASRWLPSKSVLVSIDWANNINYPEHIIEIAASKEEILSSPEYNADLLGKNWSSC